MRRATFFLTRRRDAIGISQQFRFIAKSDLDQHQRSHECHANFAGTFLMIRISKPFSLDHRLRGSLGSCLFPVLLTGTECEMMSDFEGIGWLLLCDFVRPGNLAIAEEEFDWPIRTNWHDGCWEVTEESPTKPVMEYGLIRLSTRLNFFASGLFAMSQTCLTCVLSRTDGA